MMKATWKTKFLSHKIAAGNTIQSIFVKKIFVKFFFLTGAKVDKLSLGQLMAWRHATIYHLKNIGNTKQQVRSRRFICVTQH